LVAGAAEGIGEAFTLSLAEQGFNLILVDRNQSAMHVLAEKVAGKHRVESIELHLDLAAADAAGLCLEAAKSRDCRLLVYVAAKSRISRFLSLTTTELDAFLSVNTWTMLHVVNGFSNHLKSEGEPGGIILMSSLAGLIGPKYAATYAATKSFAIRLAEALHDELKADGIDILACCAGTVSTPTYRDSHPDFSRIRPVFTDAEDVATYALKKLGKTARCIPGWRNRLLYFLLMRVAPWSLASRLVNGAMDKMYGSAFRP